MPHQILTRLGLKKIIPKRDKQVNHAVELEIVSAFGRQAVDRGLPAQIQHLEFEANSQHAGQKLHASTS